MDPLERFHSEEFLRYTKECKRMATLARGSEGIPVRTGVNWQNYISRVKQTITLPSASWPMGLGSARG